MFWINKENWGIEVTAIGNALVGMQLHWECKTIGIEAQHWKEVNDAIKRGVEN